MFFVRPMHASHQVVFRGLSFPVLRVLLTILAGCLYVFLSTRIGLDVSNGGPDEVMRSLLPKCIVGGNLLPSGYDKCAIYSLGYWSYAFYPQLLPAYLSAVFMTIARLLGGSESIIFMSGRLASVCFGLTALASTSSCVYHILRGNRSAELIACLTVVLMGFWPQFAFLSSYMNNDIAALAGVSLILLALVRGIREKWDLRSTAILCTGVVVTGLSYWNAYGFIMAGVVIFIVTVFLQHQHDFQVVLRIIVPAAIVCALCVLPFFLVNIIRYGDPVGMHAFHDRYMQWITDGGERLQTPWTGEPWNLPVDSSFVQSTVESFIAMFGYMSVRMPYPVYLMYILLAGAGIGLFLSRCAGYMQSREERVFAIGVVVACLITVGLFFYYNLQVDYQPQGRYIIYLLVPLTIASAVGIGKSFRFKSTLSQLAVLIFAGAYVAVCLWCFRYAITVTGWIGVD